MKFQPHLAALLYTKPWALLPEHHGILSAHYRAYLAGDLKATASPALPEKPAAASIPGRQMMRTVTLDTDAALGLAVVHVSGYIGHRLGDFEADCFQCCDLVDLRAAIRAIDARPELKTVVLNIASPGGTTGGLPEAAAEIMALGETRDTYAWTDDLMCSAAYWLGSACKEIWAMPSAHPGSIGVYVAALDDSRAWEMEGYQLKMFRDGALKGMGHPGKPWTPEEEDHMRSQVAYWSAEFKGHVRARRPGISDAAMQGQAFVAADAPAGVLDGLAMSYESFLESLF